jgi:hypothetical protein
MLGSITGLAASSGGLRSDLQEGTRGPAGRRHTRGIKGERRFYSDLDREVPPESFAGITAPETQSGLKARLLGVAGIGADTPTPEISMSLGSNGYVGNPQYRRPVCFVQDGK